MMNKRMLTYANKELYFIIHSNKKFQKEFNFVKSITNNIDWNNFLHLKFGEVLNEFKSKLLWRKYVFLQKLLFSFFFPWKTIFQCLVFILTCSIAQGLTTIMLIVSIVFIVVSLAILNLVRMKSNQKLRTFICLTLK